MQEEYSQKRKIMQSFNEKAIIKRLISLREQFAGLRGKSRFARALTISPSTYSYYEKNRIPPIEVLVKTCEITGTDLQWLLTGKKSINLPSEEQNIPESTQYSSLLRKLKLLLSANPQLAVSVSAFLDLLYEKNNIEKNIQQKSFYQAKAEQDEKIFAHNQHPALDNNTGESNLEEIPKAQGKETRPGWIPVLGRTAAGIIHLWEQTVMPESNNAVTQLDQLVKKHIGKSVVASSQGRVTVDLQARKLLQKLKTEQINLIQVEPDTDQEIVEFIESSQIYSVYPDCFALRIDGESMVPRINDNDIVILSPSVTAKQGQIAVVKLADQIGVTCKFIRQADDKIHLIPVNEDYDTKIVKKDDLLWALAVLCHVRI